MHSMISKNILDKKTKEVSVKILCTYVKNFFINKYKYSS